tara:strand:+ start:2184 stop:2528 length:345 start_codon:yes stop_codon:yes gene_type:complete
MANWVVLSMEEKTSSGNSELGVITACETYDGVGYARKVFTNTFLNIIGVGGGQTPYNDLTESQVVGLVQADLGASVVTDTQNYVDAKALEKRQKIEDIPVNAGLPWETNYDPVI